MYTLLTIYQKPLQLYCHFISIITLYYIQHNKNDDFQMYYDQLYSMWKDLLLGIAFLYENEYIVKDFKNCFMNSLQLRLH